MQRTRCAPLELEPSGIGRQRLSECFPTALSLLGRGSRRDVGASFTGARNHLEIVLRDSPVPRAISLSDNLALACSRRILQIMSMAITPGPPLLKKAAAQVEHLVQVYFGTARKTIRSKVYFEEMTRGHWPNSTRCGQCPEHVDKRRSPIRPQRVRGKVTIANLTVVDDRHASPKRTQQGFGFEFNAQDVGRVAR